MDTFAKKLKSVRLAHSPLLTQEVVAEKIGKTSMLISNYEKGKAEPPIGQQLEALIAAVEASEDDADELRFLAALRRNAMPDDISDYFFTSPAVYHCIRLAKSSGQTDEFWASVAASMEA